MRHVAAPSVAPVRDVTSYIVVDDFGKSGRAFRETDVAEADEEATVDALLSGQYERPIQIVAFNLEEGWVRDVSEDVARRAVEKAAQTGKTLSRAAQWLYEQHTGEDVPRALVDR